MSEQNVLPLNNPLHNDNLEDLQDFVFHWVKQFNTFHFHDKWLNIPGRSYTNGLSTEVQIELAQCVFADLLSRPHLRQAQKVYTSLLNERFLTNCISDSRCKEFPLYETKKDTKYFNCASLKSLIKQEVDAGCAMYAAMEYPIAPVFAASSTASDKDVVKRVAVPLADVLLSVSKDPDENMENEETMGSTSQTPYRLKNKM